MSTRLPTPGEKHTAVQSMFDRIAPAYDRMNALMTLGTHKFWKKSAIDALDVETGNFVVDLACGTGDLAQEAARRGAHAVGVDFSREMLAEARRRNPGIEFVYADAENLPFADGSVDAISCGFALRNFVSIDRVLAECVRVLKPGGRLALVEVDTPRARPLRALHRFYFSEVVPFVGGLLADKQAYTYLPESVVYLPNENELRSKLQQCGFETVTKRSFMFGAAQLVSARRAERPNFEQLRSPADLHCRVSRVESTSDPIALIKENVDPDAFYWEHPATGRAVATVGCVREIRTQGPARFAEARAIWSETIGRVRFGGEQPPCPVPLLVGGFGFFDDDPPAPWHGYPALRFVVPRTCWIRFEGNTYRIEITGTAAAEQASEDVAAETIGNAATGTTGDETTAGWIERAVAALATISTGTLVKLVLARTQTVPTSGRDAPYDTARTLRNMRPECATFIVRRNGRVFTGSSPELLARVRERKFETAALAGSAPRYSSPDKDEASGSQLLACPKNAREHAIVVEEMCAKLAPLCVDVIAASRPELRRLPESFHLSTPLSGGLDESSSVLDIAGALHPTSAVCGMPSDAARTRLAAEEPDRGWYAGGVGWMDASGDGEITVALRSALFDETQAVMWAGAGLIDGSIPESEFAETEAKLTAMHGALTLAARRGDGCQAKDTRASAEDSGDDDTSRRVASA